jgi:hypothetical protein
MSEHVKAALIWVLFQYLGYHKKFMGKLFPRLSYTLKMREMVKCNLIFKATTSIIYNKTTSGGSRKWHCH